MTPLRITVNTDAAYSHHYRVGGWACWIDVSSLDKPIKAYGSFKTEMNNTAHCELAAIVNALVLLQKKIDIKGAHITFKTDCKPAIGILTSRKDKPEYMAYQGYVRTTLELVKTYGFVHIFAHKYVPGDKEFGADHYKINDWCDRQAYNSSGRAIRRVKYEKSSIEGKREARKKPQISKLRQKAIARRLVRRGVKAYQRPKGDISE